MTSPISPTNPDIEQIRSMFQRVATDSFYQELAEKFEIGLGSGIYSLAVVVLLMIFQHLSPKGTLAVAVQEMARHLKSRRSSSAQDCKRIREGKISCNTGGFCQARQNVSTLVISHVSEHIFEQLRQQMPSPEAGPTVYVVDGTTMQLAHSKDLANDFPPGRNQHGDNHWPILEVVVFHDARSGLAVPPSWGPKYGPQAVSEQALAKRALGRLPADAILLGDGNFGVFFFVHAVQQSGRPIVARMTAARAASLLRGIPVPKDGKRVRVTWTPSYYERQAHPDLPADASVQGWVVVSENAADPTRKLYLFTTLDWQPKRVIALYKLRWNIETDLRSLKQTMGLQRITGKSTSVVEKQLLMAYTAYNLVRAVIYVAACREGLPPRDYSFSVSQDALMAAWGDLQRATTKAAFNRELDLLIFFVSKAKLPRRSGRRAYPREIWGRGGHFPFRPSPATKEPAQ